MENTVRTNHTAGLQELKREVQITQKKGLPFIMASVVIWSLILLLQFWDKPMITINFYTFMCSALLMPLAALSAKIVKADIFRKSSNPISRLGLICTFNQMLYLVIVMWAFSQKPEAMLMCYAVVFGAHLLPYGWVYDSKAYMVISIADTIAATVIFVVWGNAAVAVFMAAAQLVLCLLIVSENRKVRTGV